MISLHGPILEMMDQTTVLDSIVIILLFFPTIVTVVGANATIVIVNHTDQIVQVSMMVLFGLFVIIMWGMGLMWIYLPVFFPTIATRTV